MANVQCAVMFQPGDFDPKDDISDGCLIILLICLLIFALVLLAARNGMFQ